MCNIFDIFPFGFWWKIALQKSVKKRQKEVQKRYFETTNEKVAIIDFL